MAKSLLWYGESGTWKTTQIKFLAQYVYETWGKITRIASCDLGGWEPCNAAIKAGLIEAYQVRRDKDPLPQIRLLAKGYWPVVAQGRLVMQAPTAQTWEKVGAIVYESLTSIGDMAIEDVVNKGMKIAEEVVGLYEEKIEIVDVLGRTVTEQKEKFGAPGRAHYNFAQKTVYGVISSAAALPCPIVGFTALEAKSEEEDRTTIYGPAIAGKKATPKAPSWVGDCLHFDSYLNEQVVKPAVGVPGAANFVKAETIVTTKVRAYFMRHPDPKTGINHPAKPRLDSEKIPELLKKWPGGYFEPTPTEGLDAYLRKIAELDSDAGTNLQKWRDDIDAKLGRKPAVVGAPATK